MDGKAVAARRWEAEQRRALERGLLTTAQAARASGFSEAIVKRWKQLGLINDFGGGKGHPSLFDPEEIRTAPSRRKNLRERGTCTVDGCTEEHWANGMCTRHYRAELRAAGRIATTSSTPAKNAETTLRRGAHIAPPKRTPYNLLARTCPSCGMLLTTPDRLLRKKAGRLPRCHACLIASVRSNAQQRQAKTLERATNHGKQWTGPEMEMVLRGDMSVQQLALALGRTRNGVRYIRRQLVEKRDPRYVDVAGMTEQMTR